MQRFHTWLVLMVLLLWASGARAQFNPAAPPSTLAHFYEADRGIGGSPANGASVSLFSDSASGTTFSVANLTQATSTKQPTFLTAANGINGNPALRFVKDGNQHDMKTSAFAQALANGDTIFVVARFTSTNGGAILDNNISGGRQLVARNNGFETGAAIYAGTAFVSTGTAGNDNPNAHLYEAHFAGASSTLSQDGTQVASGNAGTNGLGALCIGGDGATTVSTYGDVDIAAVLIFDTSATNTQLSDARIYLTAKYITAAVANAFTLAGPSSISAGVQSANFTITPNGTTTATMTLSDGGAGGTFAPTSLTLNGLNPITFKYMPPSGSGGNTITITPTSAGLTGSPTNLTYVVQSILPNLKIAEIGDSIKAGTVVGAGNAPIVETASLLQTLHGSRTVTYSNQAISSTRTSDWVSGSANLVGAKSAFATAFGTPNATSNKVYVSLMLGTNNARLPYHDSKTTYKSELANICADLLTSGYAGVILHYPPYANTSSAYIDAQAQTLLLSYLDAINEIVAANPGTVFLGDDQAYWLFKNNSGWLSDGIHPDASHSLLLGDLQGFGIYRATTTGLATAAITTNITNTFAPRRSR